MIKTLPTNIPNLVKVAKTPMILNTKISDYNKIVAGRSKQKEDNRLREEVTTLKTEVKELKDMVQQLVQALRK